MQQVISREDVASAVERLQADGKNPSATAIRALLGKGSISTVIKLKAELEGETKAPAQSDEARRQFQVTWDLAMNEGRRLAQQSLDGAKADLQAALGEVDRVEADNLSLRQELTRLQDELRSARSEAAAASEQAIAAKAANEASANERAALSAQVAELYRTNAETVATLNGQIREANDRAHQFELELARARAILERLEPPKPH